MNPQDTNGNPITLGNRYQDKHTGRTGTATAYTQNIGQTATIQLEWTNNGDNRNHWYTSTRLTPTNDDNNQPGNYK